MLYNHYGFWGLATEVEYSKGIHHIGSINHMSWLPIEELTTEERETIQCFNKRKTTLHGKYHQQIKDLDTTHETWKF